ncbi:hypothetical protein LBMAG27_17230 [Bacteroidota bacterium]|nr:hypothetical protein LBMAG27_17230 [Bacteroidota bacterium]
MLIPRSYIVFGFFIIVVVVFSYCGQLHKKENKEFYWRNHSDSAHYVGMSTCKQCHAPIHSTFMHTGMGESWGYATMQKSKALFDKHAIVYDKIKNFYYKPYWKDSSLYILEFRLNGNDTVYKRSEKIDFIVGSGQHTNSHIWNSNGYLYQAPLTFYTQNGIWDLPPGFEDGENSRWNRTISSECMSCHNMYPDFNSTAENKFASVKTGIECERCHGPGSIHAAEKLTGILIDTSKEADRSIVNPRRLSVELQTELCERCHLQGISVLNEGKSFFDFKPGMFLNTVENVFMPRYAGGNETFIMASHADRMKQSKCFIESKTMSCLTCHNPHISVKVTALERFNDNCKNCHSNSGKTCTEDLSKRMKQSDNCVFCHMPVSSTMDIPHVTVHDHRIQIPIEKTEVESIKRFVGLECMTTKNPSALLMVQGYLAMYESYSSKSFLLDSAFYFLQKQTDKNSLLYKKTIVQYYFLKKDFPIEISWALKFSSADSLDAWTNYRIGEAYFYKQQSKTAEEYFAKAVKQKPEELQFINKLGAAQLTNGKQDDAKSSFEKIISLQPKYAPALSNLAYIYMLRNDWTYSMKLVNDALALDPDYVEALMNKAAILISTNKKQEAKKIIQQVLILEPENEKAKVALKSI